MRAGTSQDAISRIERGAEQPTVERMEALLAALGEQLDLTASPRAELNPADIASARLLSHVERLRESASWNLTAMRLEAAAEETRRT